MSATTRMSESRTAAPRSRKKYVIGFVALLLFAVFAVVVASNSDPGTVASRADVNHLPVGPKVAGLGAAKGWINSPPLTSADLAGKVVLYDFWTYSCVNCVRTIPHLRSWYDRYQKDGLVVVGVHSPEFNFEKNHDNVKAAVTRLHVDYPVALDDEMAIWSEFSNNYWPADYIADRQGHLRDMTIGEGSYTQTEDVLRKLLGIPASAPRATLGDTGNAGKPPTASEDVTPETYLGLERGIAGAQPGVAQYPDGGSLTRGHAASDRELVRRHARRQQRRTGSRDRHRVPRSRGEPRDGECRARQRAHQGARRTRRQGASPAYRTSQTMVDADGSTFVQVQASDLYRLVLGPSIGTHTLRLTAEAPNLEAFAFTFSA